MHDIRLLANKLGVLGAIIDKRMSDAFDEFSASSAAALLTLRYHGPMTTTALSRILRLSQPATTRLLARLVENALIERRPVSAGGEVNLQLTTRGRRAAGKIQQRRLATLSDLLAGLSRRQKQQMSSLLDLIVQPPVLSRPIARQLCRFCDHDICDGELCPVGCAASRLERSQTTQ